MKLTPIEEHIQDGVQEALAEVGLVSPKDSKSTREIARHLDMMGLGLPELAQQVSSLSKGSMDDSIRLRATELGLRCHGVLEKDAGTRETPQIVFVGADASIINVLFPR